MPPGLSTQCRAPRETAGEVSARLDRVAPAWVALDRDLDAALYAALVPLLLAASDARPVRVVFAPCPRPAAGRRLPALASLDRDERDEATRQVFDTLARARDLAADRVVLPPPGRVGAEDRRATLERWLAYGLLDDDGPARARLDAWREQRARQAPRALDALRFALERILGEAERRDLGVALANAALPEELPTRDESIALCRDFAGSRLGLWVDTAAAHAKEVLGLGGARRYLAGLLAAAPAVRLLGLSLSDAAGLSGGLPPGIGDIDFAALLGALPADLPRLVACGHAPEAELRAALARAASLPGSG